MKIDFASQKLEDAANGEKDGTFSELSRVIRQADGKNSQIMPAHITEALNDLSLAKTCADLPPSMHPHPLKGNRRGEFAVDIPYQINRGKFRIIFTPDHENDPNYKIDNYKTITRIKVIELCCDYH